MDRNQVIGFSLLALLLIGYLGWNQHEQKVFTEKKAADSIAYARLHPRPVIDSVKTVAGAAATSTPAADSATEALKKSQPVSYYGTAQTVTLENKKLSLQFSTKGAFPVAADIKGYKTYDQKPLYLFNGPGNYLSAILPVDNGKSTADLYFSPVLKDEPNGDKTIDFTADLGAGKKADVIYTLPADDYMMRCTIVLTGMSAVSVPLQWQTQGLKTEKNVTYQKGGTTSLQVYYGDKSDKFDYFTIRAEEKTQQADFATNWIGFRKQYFSTVLIDDDGFNKMAVTYNDRNTDSGNVVAQTKANRSGGT